MAVQPFGNEEFLPKASISIVTNLTIGPKVAKIKPFNSSFIDICTCQAAMKGMKVESWT